MVDVLMAFAALMVIACFGMFIAFMRTHSFELSNTFNSVMEAIEDIKSYKASKMK
jgi:hypothetical protein